MIILQKLYYYSEIYLTTPEKTIAEWKSKGYYEGIEACFMTKFG